MTVKKSNVLARSRLWKGVRDFSVKAQVNRSNPGTFQVTIRLSTLLTKKIDIARDSWPVMPYDQQQAALDSMQPHTQVDVRVDPLATRLAEEIVKAVNEAAQNLTLVEDE